MGGMPTSPLSDSSRFPPSLDYSLTLCSVRMRLRCIILLVVVNVWGSESVRGSDYGFEPQQVTDEFTESESDHVQSSCKWEDPPENGLNFRPCAVGACKGTKGTFSKNGTRRITRCSPHYVLINGLENDVCHNGVWSSRGHECVQCGKSPRTFDALETAALIVNGYNSSRGDFPWMAALFMPQDAGRWTQICGGTLISPDIVLTAAHCLNINGRVLKPEEIKVGLGRLSVDFYDDEPGSFVSSAKQLIIPERFIGLNRLYDLDIGLIVLEKRVPIDDHIMPACLDWEGVKKPKHNENGVLAGWGLTDVGGSRSGILKWTYQRYLGYQQCLAMMTGADHRFFSPDKFCTDEVKGGTAESGDSGGGLTFEREGYHYVYGIVSTKMLTNSKRLRLFTNVMNEIHLAWLEEKWRRLQPQSTPGVGVETVKPAGKAVVCYFTNYAWYRKSPANFRPQNINASLCTHINYGFAYLDPKELTVIPGDRWADIDSKFIQLVTNYRSSGVKVLLSVGGWTNSAPDHWSRMMSSSSSRRKFIDSLLTYVQRHNFDGVNMVYYYPGCPQATKADGQPDDTANFNLLMSELKISFAGRFLLTVTAPGPKGLIDDCYDMAPLCEISDWVNIKAFDYHTHYKGVTGPSAPLQGDSSNFGVNETLDYYRNTLGCPGNKLVLGIPFYGQTYTLADPSKPRFGAPTTGPGNAGPYTQTAGTLSYMEICENIKNGFRVRTDRNDNTFAWKDSQFISFDDIDTMEHKSKLIKDTWELRGAMVHLDYDDFSDLCGCGKFPLLRALNYQLGRTDTNTDCYN